MILFTSIEYAQSADGLYCMLGILGAYKRKNFLIVILYLAYFKFTYLPLLTGDTHSGYYYIYVISTNINFRII